MVPQCKLFMACLSSRGFDLSLHLQSNQGLCCEEEVYMDSSISMEVLRIKITDEHFLFFIIDVFWIYALALKPFLTQLHYQEW